MSIFKYKTKKREQISKQFQRNFGRNRAISRRLCMWDLKKRKKKKKYRVYVYSEELVTSSNLQPDQ